MASCFEVAMALTEGGYIEPDDLDSVTTILVETLIATGTIKLRSRAVNEKEKEEDLYTSAQYSAAAHDAMGDYQEEIRDAEVMLEAQERKAAHEQVIIEANEVIEENARLATATLVEKGLITGDRATAARKLIAEAWAATD